MLVKQSETAIAVQLCRLLCRFTQFFYVSIIRLAEDAL